MHSLSTSIQTPSTSTLAVERPTMRALRQLAYGSTEVLQLGTTERRSRVLARCWFRSTRPGSTAARGI